MKIGQKLCKFIKFIRHNEPNIGFLKFEKTNKFGEEGEGGAESMPFTPLSVANRVNKDGVLVYTQRPEGIPSKLFKRSRFH